MKITSLLILSQPRQCSVFWRLFVKIHDFTILVKRKYPLKQSLDLAFKYSMGFAVGTMLQEIQLIQQRGKLLNKSPFSKL
jgi:hypothetical protein